MSPIDVVLENMEYLDILDGKTIYTIGYERRSIDEFIKILKDNQIELVIDVREIPLSRKKGFSKNKLKEILTEHGIGYVHLKFLGTPKELRDKLKSGKISFIEFMDEYLSHLDKNIESLKELLRYAVEYRSVLMCYEKDWRKCHRSIIAKELGKIDFKVVNL
ncbi:DUF488 family protein [Methanocaldococcus indicus]|uniref:DUF488 domain-containing protein n=1 Tax=Methanocaldococcus indicus TaxID=213231 RepID=UPI003C6D5786